MKRHPSFRNIRFTYWHLYGEYNLRSVAIKKKKQLENKYNIKNIEDLDKLSLRDPEFSSNTRWDIIGYDNDIILYNQRIHWINKRIKKEAILLG